MAGLAALVPAVVLCNVCAADAVPQAIETETALQPTAVGSGQHVFVMLREPVLARHADVPSRRRRVREQRQRVFARSGGKGMRMRRGLALVSGFEAWVTPEARDRLAQDPEVVRIDPAMYGSAALANSVPQIRADAVQNRGDLGQNITVAVLDSGIDPAHPDLNGSIVAEECFCSANCCPNGTGRQSGPGSASTRALHGTHVAGIIVSKGKVAFRGVAPKAGIVAVRVLNDETRGTLTDWISALEWVAENRPDVQAINMSLASDSVYRGACDGENGVTLGFAQIITLLRSRGILTFVAAGNSSETNALAAPACIGAAVAVGAVNQRDRVPSFSDSGSGLDLLAPGVGVISTAPGANVVALSGTSMAAPHVTGTAALMLASNVAIAGDALERALKSTDVLVTDARNGRVSPRLNALSAMNAVLEQTTPVLGGGSRRTDCWVTWTFLPPDITAAQPVTAATCVDNDPACDADQELGQCTFEFSLCFNTPDRRVPYCDTGLSVTAGELGWPRVDDARSPFDRQNATAIQGALPVFPIEETNKCSAVIPFVVPANDNGGSQWVRFTARTASESEALLAAALQDESIGIEEVVAAAARLRIDTDRVRLTCLPSLEQ